MNHCRMRQMEERHVANQVDLMVWSNKLDLLAISNFKGKHLYCLPIEYTLSRLIQIICLQTYVYNSIIFVL